jgi:hypothetical protein
MRIGLWGTVGARFTGKSRKEAVSYQLSAISLNKAANGGPKP